MITYSIQWDLFSWFINYFSGDFEFNNWSPSHLPDSLLISLTTVGGYSLQFFVLQTPCSPFSFLKKTELVHLPPLFSYCPGKIFTCPECFLSGTLQATRALMVIGILLGLIAIFVSTIGMKCMKCLEDDEVQKMWMAVIGGVIFITSGKRCPPILSYRLFSSVVWSLVF